MEDELSAREKMILALDGEHVELNINAGMHVGTATVFSNPEERKCNFTLDCGDCGIGITKVPFKRIAVEAEGSKTTVTLDLY